MSIEDNQDRAAVEQGQDILFAFDLQRHTTMLTQVCMVYYILISMHSWYIISNVVRTNQVPCKLLAACCVWFVQGARLGHRNVLSA